MSDRTRLARTVQAKSNLVARAERAAYRHDLQSKTSNERLVAAREAYRVAWEALNQYDSEHPE